MPAAHDHEIRAFHPGGPTRQRPMLALVMRLGSAFFFSVILLLVKLGGNHRLWFPEMLVWRQLIPALLLFGWLAARGQLHQLRTARPFVHARRAVIGSVGMFMTLGVVLLLPLAESTVLGFTTPIFAVVLSVFMLRERVGVWQGAAVVLGLAGVVIMAHPGHAHLPFAGVAVGIGAAFMVALISIQLRDLGRTERSMTIVFYYSAMSVPMLAGALPFMPAGHDRPLHHDPIGWLMIGGIGLFGLFSQLLMTASLRFGRVSSVVVMDYAQFGWALLWGWLVFGNLPPTSTWLGAPAIIAAAAIVARREHLRTRAA